MARRLAHLVPQDQGARLAWVKRRDAEFYELGTRVTRALLHENYPDSEPARLDAIVYRSLDAQLLAGAR